MSEVLELAERCEAAALPNRELDANIGYVIDFDTQLYGTVRYLHDVARNSFADIGKACRSIPAYTASLDAAMTLVPEGWVRDIVDADNGDCICRLDDNTESFARAKTWPLAITAAALRARDAMAE